MKNGTFLLLLIAMAVLGTSLVINGIMLIQKAKCRDTAELMERDWDYGLWSKCMIQTDDGSYVKIDQYRVTDEEND